MAATVTAVTVQPPPKALPPHNAQTNRMADSELVAATGHAAVQMSWSSGNRHGLPIPVSPGCLMLDMSGGRRVIIAGYSDVHRGSR